MNPTICCFQICDWGEARLVRETVATTSKVPLIAITFDSPNVPLSQKHLFQWNIHTTSLHLHYIWFTQCPSISITFDSTNSYNSYTLLTKWTPSSQFNSLNSPDKPISFTSQSRPRMASLAASEIQSQLTSLKEAARSRSPGELGRVDQVLESCQ